MGEQQIDEEELIVAVLRTRREGAETAAASFDMLVAENAFKDLSIAQVKKAGGKATKRAAKDPSLVAPAKPAAPSKPVVKPAPEEARPSAQEQGVVIHEGLYGLITPAPECLSDSGWVRRATRAETPSYQENRDPCV